MNGILGVLCVVLMLGFGARQAPPPPPTPGPESRQTRTATEAVDSWRSIGKERSSRALVLYFGEQAATLLFLGWLAFSGAGARIRSGVRERVGRPLAQQCAYFAVLLALLVGVAFPFDVARYALSRQYGVGVQQFLPWLGDYALDILVTSSIAIAIGLGFYTVVDKRPRTWWRWVALAAVPLAILAAAAAPVYMTLFNTFQPIEDRALAHRVLALASRGGVSANEVYEIDMSRQTNAANAFVSGIGPTTVIALGDTLLENFTEEETIFVMAHEMGHYVLRHIWIGVALGALGAFVGAFVLQRICRELLIRFHHRLRFDELADVASAPMVLFVVAVMATAALPAETFVSRALERQADRFALDLTVPGDVSPEAAVSVFEKLGRLALSDPSPNPVVKWLVWTHPTIDERQESVREWARSRGVPDP